MPRRKAARPSLSLWIVERFHSEIVLYVLP
jgi:hypothetical protein